MPILQQMEPIDLESMLKVSFLTMTMLIIAGTSDVITVVDNK